MTTLAKRLDQQLGYRFNNTALLENAVTHRSYHPDHNERLEFLGDAILDLVIAHALFQKFPQATEGELTRLRANLVNKTTLATLARELKLGDYLLLGRGEIKSGGASRDSLLANVVEALLGAIYIDSDFNTCQRLIQTIYASRLQQIASPTPYKDPKTQLQEHLQACQRPLPRYIIQATEGEAHAKQFTVHCEVEGLAQVTQGIGRSRRIAEQEAAAKALQLLQIPSSDSLHG